MILGHQILRDELFMKILAIDIRAGTEDALLYNDEKSSVENCIKIVLIIVYILYKLDYVK